MEGLLVKNKEHGAQEYIKNVIVEDAINFQVGVINQNLDPNDIENLNQINAAMSNGKEKGLSKAKTLRKKGLENKQGAESARKLEPPMLSKVPSLAQDYSGEYAHFLNAAATPRDRSAPFIHASD